ncbi:MAG: biotin-dependent carboxyltransferase family protein [Gemmataceae bacterium]
MSFEVLEPGPYSLLVDAGRPHHRSRGVPLGGAADRASWMQGNTMVGNELTAVALEFALVGPSLRATCDVECAISGAPFKRSGSCFSLKTGEVLKIGPTSEGMRGYLCVHGGFRGKEILGSHTSLEPIKRGDILDFAAVLARRANEGEPCERLRASPSLARRANGTAANKTELRCIAGGQIDWFNESEFFGQNFTVTPASNRMGLRLAGNPLTRPQREMVSEPVCPGTVQVLNDGQCVILGVDAQTIGGYPKIAHVISADRDLLGQLRSGQAVSFKLITLEEAELVLELESAQRG